MGQPTLVVTAKEMTVTLRLGRFYFNRFKIKNSQIKIVMVIPISDVSISLIVICPMADTDFARETSKHFP